MNPEQIEKRILTILPDAQIEVAGADCSFTVTIISEGFAGKTTLQRQQLILAGFSDLLGNGDLHALSIKAFTLDEWNKRGSNGLVQMSS